MIELSGQDDTGGSGVASYDVYVSRDNGPRELLVSRTTATQYEFTGGVSGSTYSFISIARDNVGNVEPMPLVADTETLVIIGAWVNRNNVYDVNASGDVTAGDAITVINQLFFKRVFDPDTAILTPLPPVGYAPPYYDVSDDGKLTAIDALRSHQLLVSAIEWRWCRTGKLAGLTCVRRPFAGSGLGSKRRGLVGSRVGSQ